MFASACKIAREFTRPVVISHMRLSGKCASGIGTFVVLNADGWIVTAAHILSEIQTLVQVCANVHAYEAARVEIESDSALSRQERRRKLAGLGRPNPETPTKNSSWWSWDGVQPVEAYGLQAVDLGIARLSPFDPAWVKAYPTIKDPHVNFDPGTSLCRMGFPFSQIEPTWDPTLGMFQLPPGSIPLPIFPIEGILTRMINVAGVVNPPSYPLQFIETSSPGLKGQSGGPIFDDKGTIWGIQSQTSSYALGLGPKPAGKKKERDDQFLHVGWGVHSASVIGFLNEKKVSFQLSTY